VRYQNIILVYLLGIVPLAIILSVVMRSSLLGIEEYFPHAAIFAMLIHIGKAMQNKIAKKRYFIYICIICGIFLFVVVLSILLGIDLQQANWLALVGSSAMLAAIIIMLFDMSKIIKSTNEKVSRTLHNLALGCVMMVVLGIIFGFASWIESCQIDRLNQLG